MEKRQIVQIPSEQVKKLMEIEEIRKDLAGYPISRKVHILLQEKLKEVFQKTGLDDSRKEDWFEYIREVLPTHIFGPILIGVVKYSKEMISKQFTKMLVASEGDKTWWCEYKKDVYSVGEFLINNLKNSGFEKRYYKKYENVINKLRKDSKKLRELNLSSLSNEALLKEYLSFYYEFLRFHALTFDIDAIDICLEEKMKKKFESLVSNKYRGREFNERYSILTNANELSYLNVEELKLYNLIKKIKEKKELVSLFNQETNEVIRVLKKRYATITSEINSLIEKYWWIELGWTVRTEKDFKAYILQIKDILNKIVDIDGKIAELESFSENSKKAKEELSKDIGFDDELRAYLRIFDKYALFHDYRKEIQMKGTAVMNKFLFEISRRQGVSYDDLVWAWPSEIEEYIRKGKIELENIRRRKEAYFVLMTEHTFEELTGEKAIKRRKEELMAETKNLRDFKGLGASLGKVTGKAKVCYSAAEAIRKIKKGDILVASMTLPDYVPAMKKAAAIVTDEGGITCHAAIVSRELKIPCIVGTKIATRALKDDDLIEVNANHGVVKIIR